MIHVPPPVREKINRIKEFRRSGTISNTIDIMADHELERIDFEKSAAVGSHALYATAMAKSSEPEVHRDDG